MSDYLRISVMVAAPGLRATVERIDGNVLLRVEAPPRIALTTLAEFLELEADRL